MAMHTPKMIDRLRSPKRLIQTLGLAVLLSVSLFAARPSTAEAISYPPDISCWTRGAYLTDADANGFASFGHRAVCNVPARIVVNLKRDGEIVRSYESTLNVETPAGNYINTHINQFRPASGKRYQVVVIAYSPYYPEQSTYWTSGTPRKLS